MRKATVIQYRNAVLYIETYIRSLFILFYLRIHIMEPESTTTTTTTQTPFDKKDFHSTPVYSPAFIEDDFFHKNVDLCGLPMDEITIRLCMYSITYPFYVEGMPMADESTNIYGRVFSQYNTYYPYLQWVATPEFRFPSMKYDCTSSFDDSTTRFENEAHTFFLSFFKDDVYSTDILQTAYKGFSYDEATMTAHVFYDFSPIHDLLKTSSKSDAAGTANANLNHNILLIPELKDEPIFKKYPFLKKLKNYPSPAILYMCIYDANTQSYVNVDVDMEPASYMSPLEHPILGCTSYYFTETPLDENIDVSRLVRFACIQSRIMYEVRIEGEDVFYMGDNVGEFKEDFEMGVLMCSTLHFEENGRRFIAIKSDTHWIRI